MKRKEIRPKILGTVLLLTGIAVGAAVTALLAQALPTRALPQYIPPLRVTGDVEKVVTLNNIQDMGQPAHITYQGTEYQAFKLSGLIDKAQPAGSSREIYYVTADGFVAAIPAQTTEDCYITYSAVNGWEAINLQHPLSSNAKLLQEIIVVAAAGGSSGLDFVVLDQEKVLWQTTPGSLAVRPLTEYLRLEGKAEVVKTGKVYESTVYSRLQVFKLTDFVSLGNPDRFWVMGANGQARLMDGQGYFQVKDNYLNYFLPETKESVEKVRGVIVNPPAVSVTDIYYDVRHYLENGQKVLLVIMDGLTYESWQKTKAAGLAPFLAGRGPAARAVGVYPAQAETAFAAMLTGQEPAATRLVTGKNTAPSIFGVANELQRKTLWLEGGSPNLQTEIAATPVGDENNNGSTGDELWTRALASLKGDYGLIVVHCPDMKSITETDKFLAESAAEWQGKIIITGNQKPGSGEEFSVDSMFVPYFAAK